MKGNSIRLGTLFDGNKHFWLPIYQRRYSWKRQHIEQLWRHAENCAAHPHAYRHHFGPIIVRPDSASSGEVNRAMVIDGQQRLTTITLLYLAMTRVLGEDHTFERTDERGSTTTISAAYISSRYLCNAQNFHGSDTQHKLSATEPDQATLERLLAGRALPEEPNAAMVDALEFFMTHLTLDNIQTIYEGLTRLSVMETTLEDGDNPKQIFESHNSMGMALTQADQIRSHVMYRLDDAAMRRLHRDVWQPMEKRFTDPEHFSRFIRDFVSLRTGQKASRLNEVYTEFAQYFDNAPDPDAVIEDLATMARYYAALLEPTTHERDTKVAQALDNLRQIKFDIALPFLLQIYSRYRDGTLPAADLIDMLVLTESYRLRRSVCNLPMQGLDRVFPKLYDVLDPDDLARSLHAYFLGTDLPSYQAFPSDDDFRQALRTRKIYKPQRVCKHMLIKMERSGREAGKIDDLTLEHIIPQTSDLSPAWLEMLGPDARRIQNTYLHTLANMTLTAFNSELGARPFLEKRDMPGGYRDSALRINASLRDLTCFDEAAIAARGTEMIERAVVCWPSPRPYIPASPSHRAGRNAPAQSGLRDLYNDIKSGVAACEPAFHADVRILKAVFAHPHDPGYGCTVTMIPASRCVRVEFPRGSGHDPLRLQPGVDVGATVSHIRSVMTGAAGRSLGAGGAD